MYAEFSVFRREFTERFPDASPGLDEIPDEDAEKMTTVGAAIDYLEQKVGA